MSSNSNAKPIHPVIKYYLAAYNLLSALGWSYVLVLTLTHILSPSPLTTVTQPSASSTFARLFSPFLKSTPFASPESKLPPWVAPYLRAAQGTYGVAGLPVAAVQSAALLELVHAAAGWVRSPIATTALQVASRLYLVWGITEQFDVTRISPFYTSMILSWSLTEVIRYSYYFFSLVSSTPQFLVWLRYTTFYVLYPLGAGSEAALIYTTLPRSDALLPGWRSWLKGMWGPGDYIRGGLFLIWGPGLYMMYTYMIKQRKKVLGRAPGQTLAEKKTS